MKPADKAEHTLIDAILEGRFAPGTRLPAERELASILGVTRPTLRETLSKLSRDGWIEVQHGKSTRVNDYLRDGGLNVLGALMGAPEGRHDLVRWLLEVRSDLAPSYTGKAVAHAPEVVAQYLGQSQQLSDQAEAFTLYDWGLHHTLSSQSGNPVYTMILNGFKKLYLEQGPRYFGAKASREASLAFYQGLAHCCQHGDAQGAEDLCAEVMAASLTMWRVANAQQRKQ